MSPQLPERCPNCGLILLSGAIFDAIAKEEEFGPILRLSTNAKPEEAKAGYVCISSLWMGDDPKARDFYRCPRCNTDPLIDDASSSPRD